MSGLRTPIFAVPNRLDELDAAIGSLQASQQERTDTSRTLGAQTPAPTARTQANTARAYGIDPSSVPAQLMAPDAHADLIRSDSPLSSWLSNPSNSAQVQDDLASMTSASWLLQRQPTTLTPPTAMQRSVTAFRASWRQNTEVVDARWNQMISGATPEENTRLNALSESLSRQQQQEDTPLGVGLSVMGASLNGVARLGADVVRNAVVTAPSMIRGFYDAGIGASVGATLGAAAGLAGGPLAEVTVPAGAAAGAQAGALAGGFLSAMRSEGALHLDALMRARTAFGNAIDEGSARAQAWGVGLINGVLEMTGEVLFVGSQAGLRNLLPSSLIASPLRESVASAVGQQTRRGALGAFARSMGARIGEETLTEGLQAIAPGLSNISLGVANDRGEAYGLADVGRDVLDSGIQAAEATLLLGLPTSFANYAGNHVRAAKAQATSEYFTALAETMGKSAAVQQAPETVAAMIRHVAPDAPTVYVPAEAWATFFQAASVAPEQAAQEILGDAGSYITAAQTGGYVAIPMDVYATKLAAGKFHEAVAGDLKINLNDLSQNEASSLTKELTSPEAIQTMLDDLAASLPVAREGEDAVRQHIVSQLQAAGVKAEQAAPLAELHALVYRALAERSGQSVSDLAAQRDVTVLGGRQAAAMLQPSAALGPDGVARNLSALSAADFEAATARVQELRDSDYTQAHLIPENVLLRVEDAGGGAGAEDMRGAIEAAGYSVEEWKAAKATMAAAQFRLAARDKTLARVQAEAQRRADGGAVRQSADALANGPDIYADTETADDFIGADGQPLFQVGAPVDGRTLFQSADASGKNGFIQFRDGKHKVLIGLLDTKNPSTFIHESAHLFVEMLLDTATRETASEQLKADAATIREWLGVESGPLNEAQHEQFARAFESYWETAKAPSSELASIFTKFRVWITSVYKSIGGLNIPISDEVRAVFDRLVAGEAAVAAAQQDVQAGRFTSAEQGQMTPEQFATYQAHGATTAEAFAANVQARLREETQRESRAFWKDEVARRTTELTAALQEQPVYQAIAALAGDEKLPRQWVEDHYGPDARKDLTRRKLTTLDGGVDPSLFALEHGFASESEMIDALLRAEPLAKVVGVQVKADMARDYGNLLNDSAAMAQAVQAALHDAATDPMAQLLAEELAILGRVRGLEVPARVGVTPLQSIRRLARDVVSRQVLKDLRPHGYLVAERKAAKEVEAALTGGKQQDAYAAKRRQLLNHVLYAEAVQAQTDAREARATLLTYTKTATRQKIGKIGQAWLEQIDGLLERVDLKQRTKSATEAVQDFIAFLNQRQADGDPLAQSLGIINAIPGVPYQLLTVQQMRDLRDAVTTLGTGARNEGKAQALAKGATQEGIRAELLADVEQTGRLAKRLGDPMAPAAQTTRSRGRTLGALRTLPSLLREFGGGNETSAWWRYLLRPLNEASVREVGMLRDAGAAMERVDAILTKADRKHMERESFTLASGQKLTVREMLAVALNTGTEGNQQRLRDGNSVTDSEMQQLREQLSDRQLQWVQGVWDLLDAYWPDTEALAKRLDGVAPEKVEAVPFVVRGQQYRGGYYRIKYDPTRSGSTAMIEAAAEGKDYSAGAAFRGQTKHGSRIERLEKVSSPLRLDLRVIDEHINEVVHDLTHAEVLRDMGGVLRDRDFVTAMQQTVGHDQFYQVQETYRDLVRNGRPLGSGSALAEKFARHVSAFSIAFNISSAVINLTNYTSSVHRVGAPWVLRGIYQAAAHPQATRDMVLETSEFMRQRATHATRNAGEEITKTFQTEGLSPYLRVVQSYGHHVMHATQQVVDIPTWLGAYQKATASGLDDATAVQVADQAIIDSQGSNATKDMALVMRERGGQKMFTAMFSYMSMQYNLISAENRLTLQSGTRAQQVAGITANLLLGVVFPAVLGKLVRDTMKGENPFDEDGKEWAKEIAAYTLSLAPGLREISGYFQGFNYSGPAGARLFGASGKLVEQVTKAVDKGEINAATLRAANTAAGLYFGYPGVQLDRTVRGIGALIDGRTGNPFSIITGPPRSPR